MIKLKISRTLYQVTVVGVSQASNAQKMKRVFPINMVLYVVSEPLILGFKSEISQNDKHLAKK